MGTCALRLKKCPDNADMKDRVMLLLRTA